ncbi:uncharacterized protein RHOBADRAFT_55450 [Rhodotorula graminis WP1]|uniref:Uncharacterized protein n=1 Tax=Rhodotorula graminis (strain WP1) TaxID=578459 RepID=A0A0P9EUC5_RHOGW|nr:uncharacterized protein RHOBADRAFT_55450 [Rhodotorula graminis WP1]KPV72759.1 hypothetical protein RHOBADRAFT_55450 [Rhodotorula graminis WP1]
MANRGRATPLPSPGGRSTASSDAFELNIEAQMLALLGQNEERKAAKLDKKRDAILKRAHKLKDAYEAECAEAVGTEEARINKRLEEHRQEDARIAAEARKCERQLLALLRQAAGDVGQAGVRVQAERDMVAQKVDTVGVSLLRLADAHNEAVDGALVNMWAGEAAAVKLEERAGEEGNVAA